MVEELAVDSGLEIDTPEYFSFVGCVKSLLEYGCTYSDDMMATIRQQCRQSTLPLARKVLEECTRVQASRGRRSDPASRGRRSDPVSRGRRSVQVSRGRRSVQVSRGRRSVSRTKTLKWWETYESDELDESKGSKGSKKRPMSPLFQPPRSYVTRERRTPKRPMSPLFQRNPEVPCWPSKKRRRR
jgi:hypothetical protein